MVYGRNAVEVRLPHIDYTTMVYVAKAAYEAQRLISIPVIKTHRHASFSCALKNTVRCVHGKNKPWMYGSGWEAAAAELNAAVRPHLYVVDGLQSRVRGGDRGLARRRQLRSFWPVGTRLLPLS